MKVLLSTCSGRIAKLVFQIQSHFNPGHFVMIVRASLPLPPHVFVYSFDSNCFTLSEEHLGAAHTKVIADLHEPSKESVPWKSRCLSTLQAGESKQSLTTYTGTDDHENTRPTTAPSSSGHHSISSSGSKST